MENILMESQDTKPSYPCYYVEKPKPAISPEDDTKIYQEVNLDSEFVVIQNGNDTEEYEKLPELAEYTKHHIEESSFIAGLSCDFLTNLIFYKEFLDDLRGSELYTEVAVLYLSYNLDKKILQTGIQRMLEQETFKQQLIVFYRGLAQLEAEHSSVYNLNIPEDSELYLSLIEIKDYYDEFYEEVREYDVIHQYTAQEIFGITLKNLRDIFIQLYLIEQIIKQERGH